MIDVNTNEITGELLGENMIYENFELQHTFIHSA